MQRTIRTPDGRLLAVEDGGDPDGWPVLVHHGTPSSRLVARYGPFVQDAAERGLRLIGYDRPGYGESSPQPGRTVADSAADIRAICAELGIDRLVTWGHSGGGQYALACAALLPELVTAAATVAGLAPFDAEGLDWVAGMSRDDVALTRLLQTDEVEARENIAKLREVILAMPSDEGDEFQEAMLSCTKAGLAPGSQGLLDDNYAQILPWGFDVADLAVPVLLLHGRQDEFVPVGHGEWLAKHIPGVEARLPDDDGHGTVVQNHLPEVHAWLAEHR